MAKISSPIGPTIDVVATTVSRSVIAGGGGGRGMVPTGGGGAGGGEGTGRGGAIVVRPQTSLVDRAQDLRIQKSEESVSTLGQSLGVIQTQVTDLGNSINLLAGQLKAESALEQAQLRQEQENERRLAESKIRLGRENALERGITAALARPIAALQKSVGSIFDKIMSALTTLFFGWLTDKGIETLKAFASGDTKKLEEIKNAVISSINNVLRGFRVIQRGFGFIMKGLTGLITKVLGLVGKIALAPFKLIGQGILKMLGLAGSKQVEKAIAKGSLRTMLGAIPVLGAIPDFAFAAVDFMQGKTQAGWLGVGAGLASLSTPFTGPVGEVTSIGLSLAATGSSVMADSDKESSKSPPPKSTPAQTKVPPAKQPPSQSSSTSTTPAATSSAKAAVTPQQTISSASQTSSKQDQKNQQITDFGESTIPYTMSFETKKDEEKTLPVSAANIQAPPKAQTPVGTLPEPQPNIIMAGGGEDKTQVASTSQQQPLTDVPFIPSSNPNNFYVLYSQLNYNVVM